MISGVDELSPFDNFSFINSRDTSTIIPNRFLVDWRIDRYSLNVGQRMIDPWTFLIDEYVLL
jgi:hypothetical protein